MAQAATAKSATDAPALPKVPDGLFIANTFREASDGGTTNVVNPANNRTLIPVARGTADDAKAALDAAEQAFQDPEWRDMDPSKRGKLLLKLADAVKSRFNDFVLAETLQNGKTLKESQGDIAYVVNTLTYYAGMADKIQGTTIPVPGGRFDYTLREPVGVTVHIAPWNYPLLLSVRSVAPALAAGNTVILKPAAWTPLTGLLFGEAAAAAGLPAGVVNVVPGPGSTVGETLVSSRSAEAIAFTGSCAVGQHVMQTAAQTTKRVVMELGGKSPVIVLPDADLDKAVKGVGWGIFANAGQMCWAGSRLIVHESIADAFYAGLKAFAEKLAVGPGWQDETRMGPVVHADHLKTVTGYVEAGAKAGATVLTGGKRLTTGVHAQGNFLQPTVFTDVTPDMKIWQEEIFGPVLTATTYTDEAEALRLANDTTFGLWSGVWTRDLSAAHRIASRIEAGMVGINEGPVTFPQTPFGGFKQSGVGTEQGMMAVDSYTRTKNVMIRL